MATITYIPTRRVIITALRRVLGARTFVVGLSFLLGLALFLWAQHQLRSMFARDETGEIVVTVESGGEGCVVPSLYLMPSPEEPDVYYGALDALGGGIGDPSIMNIGRPSVALTYEGGGADPLTTPRGDPATCPRLSVRISGGIERVAALSDADRPGVNVAPSPVAHIDSSDGGATIGFDLAKATDESAARIGFRIEGVRDIWQYGYRRINLWNGGGAPVNVFLLGEPGYLFLSEVFDPISVPVRNRSVAAMHLSRPGRDGGNAYQVFSRLIDYDARLQAKLITVSTIFGIGISLLVEGAILALLKLARRFRSPDAADDGDHLRDEDGG